MRHFALIALLAGLLSGCSTKPEEGPAKVASRAEMRKVGGAEIEIVPREGQYPYCLVFTVSATGLVRLLTQTEALESIPCEAGKPVGGVKYHVPNAEGRARVLVFFTDRVVKAGPIATRISEIGNAEQRLNAFDFRVPGQMSIEEFLFVPDTIGPIR
ncbi:MAG TPA: hypothetical protein VFS43_03175 [Polyangiaceae bacterium]|nr:hypothetical protein [Polyangiaceae bacterium]